MDAEAKQGNDLIGHSLSRCLISENLVGCFWFLLNFVFWDANAFTGIDSGLGFFWLAYVGYPGITAIWV